MSLPGCFFAVVSLFCTLLCAQSIPEKPMARDAHPSFAVATVKLHDPASNRGGFRAQGQHFAIYGRSIASMMQFAYALHPSQIVDAPDWAFKSLYDVEGITDTPGEPYLRQQQEMLQKLMADRFNLHFVRAKRVLPVYAIKIAKGGPKLKPTAHPDAEPDQDASVHGTEITQIYTSAEISDFIMGMQFFILDRPFVDLTGLTGRYDIRLTYSGNTSTATDANSAPGIFTAIQEQLGLKLEPMKAPVDVYIIDHIDKPSEN